MNHPQVSGQVGIVCGIPVVVPNTISVDKKDFYVSYNTVDSCIYGSVTTALVVGQMEKFYILNGDHREDYSLLSDEGFDACFAYFLSKNDQWNNYSDIPAS